MRRFLRGINVARGHTAVLGRCEFATPRRGADPTLERLMHLRRNAFVYAVLCAIVACEADQPSLTGVPRSPRASAAAASPSTATISPSGDTRINDDATNYSTDTILTVYTWPDDSIANAIIMKFDFGGIPAGATISSATLNLYLHSSDATTDATYTIPVQQIINKNPVVEIGRASCRERV